MSSQAESNRSTGFYAPELDGLRCFAVLAVMISHFSWTWKHYFDWGGPGVRLFFVLSGFLITLLLLRARARCTEGVQTPGRALRQFFIRRIFRLWPLYFASLAVAYGFHLDGTQTAIAWHAFFATNHYVFSHQDWPVLLSHYWTLAVEQQFYVLWPFALLWLPGRILKGVALLMLVSGPFARWFPLAMGINTPNSPGVLLPACLDFFALGSAVAWAWGSGQLPRYGSRVQLRVGIVATVVWLLFGALLRIFDRLPPYWTVYDPFIQGIGFAHLLVYLLRFPDSWLAAILRWAPFVFFGQISYGIYILHNFMHRFGPSLLRRITGAAYLTNEVMNIIYYVSLTVAAAVVSYYFLEVPARRLGHRLAAAGGASQRNDVTPG